MRADLAIKCAEKLGRPLAEIWPPDDLQLMHYQLFPHGVFHAENVGGMIDEVLDQRLWIASPPNAGAPGVCKYFPRAAQSIRAGLLEDRVPACA